jgi:hypothetical protein
MKNFLICGVIVSFFLGRASWGAPAAAAPTPVPATAVAPAPSPAAATSPPWPVYAPPDGDFEKLEKIQTLIDKCEKFRKEKKEKEAKNCDFQVGLLQKKFGGDGCEAAKKAHQKASNDFNKECGKANLPVGKSSEDSTDDEDSEDSLVADSSIQNSACYAEVLRCKNAPGSYGPALNNFNMSDGAGALSGLMQNMLGGNSSSARYCPTKLGKDVASEREKAQDRLQKVQDSITESNKTLDEAKSKLAEKQQQSNIDINKMKSDMEMMAVKKEAEQFDIYSKVQQQIQALSLRIKTLNIKEVEFKNQIESSEAAKVAKLQGLMLTCDQKFESEKQKMDSTAVTSATTSGPNISDLSALGRKKTNALNKRKIALQKIWNDCKKIVSIQWKSEVALAESVQSKARAEISSLEAEITTVQDQISQLRNAVRIQLELKTNTDNLEYKNRLQAMNDSLNAVNTEAQLLQSMQNRITSENNMKNMQLIMAGQGITSNPMGNPSNTSTIYDVNSAAQSKDEAYDQMYQACCIGFFDTLNTKLCSKVTNERIEKVFGNSDKEQ